MEKRTFSIPNMTCHHCVMSIKNELTKLQGVRIVEGNADKKSVTVEWEFPATVQKIKETLKTINYPAASEPG